jgi:tetratricopeptide (TPR) repeat protein
MVSVSLPCEQISCQLALGNAMLVQQDFLSAQSCFLDALELLRSDKARPWRRGAGPGCGRISRRHAGVLGLLGGGVQDDGDQLSLAEALCGTAETFMQMGLYEDAAEQYQNYLDVLDRLGHDG